MKVIAKVTEHMAGDARDIWIVKGKTYILARVIHDGEIVYHFIDEQGDDHYLDIEDFDKYFKEVNQMAKELLWTEDGEKVYGLKDDFGSEADFIKTVRSQSDEDIVITELKIEACISSTRTIPAEVVIPLTDAKLMIENYITAFVEVLDATY